MSTVGTKKETDHPAAREATSNQASKPQAQPPRVGRLRLVKKVRLPDVASGKRHQWYFLCRRGGSLGCSQNLETAATQAKTYEAEMGS